MPSHPPPVIPQSFSFPPRFHVIRQPLIGQLGNGKRSSVLRAIRRRITAQLDFGGKRFRSLPRLIRSEDTMVANRHSTGFAGAVLVFEEVCFGATGRDFQGKPFDRGIPDISILNTRAEGVDRTLVNLTSSHASSPQTVLWEFQ